MNILLVNQFFLPDSAPTGALLTDVAVELVRMGHRVDVICGAGNYAKTERAKLPEGVHIHASPAFPFARGVAGRVLSYASFLGSAFTTSLSCPSPDLVVTLTTPPLISSLGTFLKLTRQSRHVIWEMDVYPDVAVALNYLKRDGIVDRLSRIISDFARHRADGVLVLGECMRDVIIRHKVDPARVHVVENWSDGQNIRPTLIRDDGKLTLLYSGNLGLAHDVDTVEQTIRQLRDDPHYEFIFAGGGYHHTRFERRCAGAGLKNAFFRDYCSKDMLSQSLAEGDIGLVTQRDECTGLVVPSKVYGIMAAARPLLFIGSRDATPARIIDRYDCGWRVNCGDSRGLIQLLERLAGSPETVQRAGNRARIAFSEHYDKPQGVARVCQALGAYELTGNKSVSKQPPLQMVESSPVLSSRSTQAGSAD